MLSELRGALQSQLIVLALSPMHSLLRSFSPTTNSCVPVVIHVGDTTSCVYILVAMDSSSTCLTAYNAHF